jgi:transposase InsO family protein
MQCTPRLAEANVVPSLGSVGDSYDNALAQTINGLYEAKVIWRQRSWPSVPAVELATFRWVNCFNNDRLLGPFWAHPACWGQGQLLSSQRHPRYGGMTQFKLPPEITGRFSTLLYAASR